MNLKIELANSEFCDGCPCFTIASDESGVCAMGYWDDEYEQQVFVGKRGKRYTKAEYIRGHGNPTIFTLRPIECINNHGK